MSKPNRINCYACALPPRNIHDFKSGSISTGGWWHRKFNWKKFRFEKKWINCMICNGTKEIKHD